MAIDSQNKRFSMIGFGQVFIVTPPAPDGTIAQAERPMLLNLYQGLTLEQLLFYTVNIVMRLAESTIEQGITIPSRVVSLFKRSLEVDLK